MSGYRHVLRIVCGALLLNLFSVSVASAVSFVSVGNGCNYTSLPALLDDIKQHHVVTDEIHLLASYVSPPIDTTGIVIYIGGGYAACDAAAPTPGAVSVITSNGALKKSVVKVRSGSNNNSILNLHDLHITGGDAHNNSDGNGGGISFNGHGELDLTHVIVDHNYADNGGGIDVDAEGTSLTSVYLSGSSISQNRTQYDGAGIRVGGSGTRLFILEDALGDMMEIANNSAGVDISGNMNAVNTDRGGGLLVRNDAEADISRSTSSTGIHLIHGNVAHYGGGIAVSDSFSRIRIFTTRPSEQVTISDNLARRNGGGIYAGSQSLVCAFGYDLAYNTAQDGAAIYADTDAYGFNLTYAALSGDPSLQNYICATDDAYGAVFPNVANQIVENHTSNGSTIALQSSGGNGNNVILADFVTLQYNYSYEGVLKGLSSTNTSKLTNCLVANNSNGSDVLVVNSPLVIDSCTLSRNSVNSGSVIASSKKLTVRNSILWHPAYTTVLGTLVPAVTTLAHNGSDPVAFTDAIVHDTPTANVISTTDISSSDPLFINGAYDYHLAVNSPAIDYTATSNFNTDLDNNYRGVVLVDQNKRYDIGAYERQTGNPPITFPPDETFDELGGVGTVPGMLPGNWVTTPFAAGTAWRTSAYPDSGSLAAYCASNPGIGDSTLDTPAFSVVNAAQLTFRKKSYFPNQTSGAVLEIKIGTGAFTDILAAGGHFVSGGYTSTIADNTNPIGFGRGVWTGDDAGYNTVVVDLPATANGQSVTLRWRVASGNATTTFGGFFVDTIHVDLNRDVIFADGFEPGPQ